MVPAISTSSIYHCLNASVVRCRRLVHSQLGADEVVRVRAATCRWRAQISSRALFLQAGTPVVSPPLLADLLADSWAILGSAALPPPPG